MLSDSKINFHNMFMRTYGILNQRNSDVFTGLFKDLEAYHENGNLDLEEALRKYFSQLYQTLFTFLQPQYTFDSR